MNLIAKIISLELIWLCIFMFLFTMIHAWRQDRGTKKTIIFLMSDIVAAIVVSYPLW